MRCPTTRRLGWLSCCSISTRAHVCLCVCVCILEFVYVRTYAHAPYPFVFVNQLVSFAAVQSGGRGRRILMLPIFNIYDAHTPFLSPPPPPRGLNYCYTDDVCKETSNRLHRLSDYICKILLTRDSDGSVSIIMIMHSL